jgi:hypothetical protein
MDMLYKSGSVFHQESNKIRFAFFDFLRFSTDFLRFSNPIEVSTLQPSP